ncbi:MAG: hypothetical protein V1875_06325 [Candidatus Altiarchaeota archaeon]
MGKTKYALELLFGIGFKIGLLIALIGLIMLFMPLIQINIMSLLKSLGVYFLLDQNPEWVRVMFGGFLLMVGASVVSILQRWFEPFIELLFFEDNYSKPKQL